MREQIDEVREKVDLVKGKTTGFLGEFRKFALRGNVIDLAVGVIIGAAFNNIVQSLVKDIIMPPIGYLTGRVDFSDLYFNFSSTHYESLMAADAAGAPIVKYGLFLNNLIQFFLTAFVIFLFIKQVNKMHKKEEAKEATKEKMKTCPYCLSEVKEAATRCPNCTSEIPKKISKASAK